MALSLLVLADFYHLADQALAHADCLASAVGARLVLYVRRDAILDPEQLSGPSADLDTEAINLVFTSLVRESATRPWRGPSGSSRHKLRISPANIREYADGKAVISTDL